jgi:hypothetical protein
MDDILMFTAYAPQGQPFRGLVAGQVRESNMAEVIWFCRGNTLYRRTLLILPDLEFQTMIGNPETGLDFYRNNDVSVRFNPDTTFLAANSLEDLSLRQNRFGHAVGVGNSLEAAFPFNIHQNSAVYYMRMPTMQETSLSGWDASQSFAQNLVDCLQLKNDNTNGPFLEHENGKFSYELPARTDNKPFIDFWEQPFPWTPRDNASTRYEDVLLNNVISFDIQVWDDVAGRYVNMGEAQQARTHASNNYGDYDYGKPTQISAGPLGGQGSYPLLRYTTNTAAGITTMTKQNIFNSVRLPCVYDTWSEEYERDGYSWPNQAGVSTLTQGRNQIDFDGNGVIDDIGEWTTPPPYNVPLHGIKITIRTFDPLSKNIREMTVVHSFRQ